MVKRLFSYYKEKKSETQQNRCCLFMIVTLGCFTMACSEHRFSPLSAETPLDYSQYGRPPIPAKILLLFPAEFERFEHTSNIESSGIRYYLGRDAELEMRNAFGIEFAKVEIMQVRSETKAIGMLLPNDPENARVRSYDYVAIPKFLRADSTEDKVKYGFEVDLQVEFTANNGSSITITGYGESMIGKDAQSTRE
jgi:hypothetical protein